MAFEILRGKPARAAADAVVCLLGSRAEGDVLSAAGRRLRREIRKREAPAPGTAAAVRTQLPDTKYLVIASPPAEEEAGGEGLRQAYISALRLAESLGCVTVALPLSEGGPGREEDVAAAISACTVFLAEHDADVRLIVGESDPAPAGGLFDELKAYIAANLAPEHNEALEAAAKPIEKKTGAPGKAALHGKLRSKAPASGLARETEGMAYWLSTSASDSLEDFLKLEEIGFSEYLLELLKEKNVKDSEIYRRAQVSRQLFNRIVNNRDYRPNKSTAIQLALALELDTEQTQKLLEKAGYSLTRSSRADLVIQYFIGKGIFSIPEINMALFDCGLPLLKTGSGA